VRFIEEAVRWRALQHTIQDIGSCCADTDPDEIQRISTKPSAKCAGSAAPKKRQEKAPGRPDTVGGPVNRTQRTSHVLADGELLDPVAAYDRLAPTYARLALHRAAYLNAVDRLILAAVPPGSRSMLDVGSGDGARAARIAEVAGLPDLTLLEPSERMRSYCPAHVTLWALRAEDLRSRQGSFDIVTCLWNVLGHIMPSDARLEALRQFARLVSPQGRIFIDVNHRYNARHYGIMATAMRFLRDRLSPEGSHGDVRVVWDVDGHPCATTGHVFTHAEFAGLAGAAGLSIERRFVIDYASGELRRRACEGNLLYVLRPAPPAA
jgi:SAM-dependent methyltransferase